LCSKLAYLMAIDDLCAFMSYNVIFSSLIACRCNLGWRMSISKRTLQHICRAGWAVSLLGLATTSAMAQTGECPSVDASKLTLEAAAARALCLNPTALKAAATTRQSQAALNQARAARAPVWSANANPSWSWQRADGSSSQTQKAGASVGASYTLMDGGARNARVAQSQQDLIGSEQQQAATRQDALKEFIGLWADARDAQATLQARMAAVASAKASEAASRARLDAGSATRVDVLSAQSSLAQAQLDEISAQTGLRKAIGVLAQYLSLNPLDDIRLMGDDLKVLDTSRFTTSTTPQALTELLRQQHPDLKSQQASIESARAALDASRADGKPQLSLTGSAGPTWSRSNTTGSYSSGTQWSSQVGLNLSYTFSDGGSRDATIARSQAQLDTASAAYQETERSLSTTLWQSYADWRDADASVAASRLALDASIASEAAQSGRYRAGLGTINDVLTAQTQLAQARQQLATTEQRRLRAHAALLHAVGQLNITSTPAKP
jgi:outer membrane protein